MSAFKVGDLVMVVKPSPCCGDSQFLGVVSRVEGSISRGSCKFCGVEERNGALLEGNLAFPVAMLRLIPPLSDDETTEREVEHAA